jgi:sulfonate transport system ATP-binding protein
MLVCEGLGRRFTTGDREVVALAGVSLAFAPGTFTVLVGPSGCGKTTLLRLLAGLATPTEGVIRHLGDGRPPSVGYVFQEPRLMPWLTVADNIGFALKGRRPKAEIADRVAELLDLTGLAAFAAARPHQLSGGMASRVGLARALAGAPDLLLLDEPFAALDALTRRRLQGELLALWARRRPTVVFVTHDVEEAVLLADRIVRLDGGTVADSLDVALPRPRDPTDAAVVAHRRLILAGLEAGPEPHASAVHNRSHPR